MQPEERTIYSGIVYNILSCLNEWYIIKNVLIHSTPLNLSTDIVQIHHLSFGISAAYPLRGETMRDKVATEDLNVKLSALRRLSGCGDINACPSHDDKKGALKKSRFFMQVLQGGPKTSRVPRTTSPPSQTLQQKDRKREITCKPPWPLFHNVAGERRGDVITTPTGISRQVANNGENNTQDTKKMEILLSRSELSRSITSPTSSHKAALSP